MADYYPLLARALDALSDTSPDMRRAVYERARSALMDQLRGLDPPLAESDIARERLSLDEAINRIEAEHARRVGAAGRESAPGRSEAFDAEPSFPGANRAAEPDRPAPHDLDVVGATPPQRERPRVDTVSPQVARGGRGRSIILGAALFTVIGGIAFAAWLLRDRPPETPPAPPVVAAPPPPPENDRKIAERVGGDRAPPPVNAPAAPAPPAANPSARAEIPVAQRAMLFEENAANPATPIVSPGRATWRLDAVNAGPGMPLETVVRATVEVQGIGLTLNLVIRRNLDQTLPASHTVELAFTTPPNDSGRAVRDVGVLQFKKDEAERGTPVAGLPVPVKENLFLIGLSNLPGDVERNADLLLRRNWIDLPVRFASGQRAILSFEKGVSGEQVLAEAFQQWR
jgi:hypothetical protein